MGFLLEYWNLRLGASQRSVRELALVEFSTVTPSNKPYNGLRMAVDLLRKVIHSCNGGMWHMALPVLSVAALAVVLNSERPVVEQQHVVEPTQMLSKHVSRGIAQVRRSSVSDVGFVARVEVRITQLNKDRIVE
jgi:hypothetical protein